MGKYEHGDLLVDFHNILKRWKNYFTESILDQWRWTKHTYTADSLITDQSSFDISIANAKFETFKSPGCDQFLPERSQYGDEILLSQIRRNYWLDFLHSSDIGEEIEEQRDSTSATHIIQESLWFNEQGTTVQ
jgi:hypothetical protein